MIFPPGYGQLDEPTQQQALIVNINLGPETPRPGDGELTQVLPPQPEASADSLSELAHAAEVLDLD
jgi:hypothetical protein